MKDDIALVVAALSGDPERFSPIIERYQDAVFAVALARLRDFHDAEDIAQEVFIEAFEHLGKLNDPGRLGAWLRSITIHRCIDHLRRRREIIGVEEIAEQLEDTGTPHTEMEKRELSDQVMIAIGQLSKKQRETTTLFYIDGYSQAEVARIQEVPVGTVKRRLHDAREKLKEEMIGLVEDVLKSGAPREDFGKRVFEILSRYGHPPVSSEDWEEIGSQLREIGTAGMDGFVKALESWQWPASISNGLLKDRTGRSSSVIEANSLYFDKPISTIVSANLRSSSGSALANRTARRHAPRRLSLRRWSRDAEYSTWAEISEKTIRNHSEDSGYSCNSHSSELLLDYSG
ncbi:RNA polymerase sigma factor [Candidatus Poribacteria bacterium]